MATERFEPALYSVEENQFLADHAGEAPSVALFNGVPPGVNPKAVRPVLEKVYNALELEKHQGVEWAGVAAIKQACQTYIQSVTVWAKERLRGVPYPPTMYEWDARGRPHRGAVGSDSGFARTYFGSQGQRVPLGVDYLTDGDKGYVPEWVSARKPAAPIPTALLVDDEKGHITCPICNYMEQFEAGQQSKRNMALARMNKHLINPKSGGRVEDHRVLYGNVVSGTP